MCGIAGIVFRDSASAKFEEFKKSFQLMQHRGPDHTGAIEEKNFGLYHHRLSIIDLSPASNQPYTQDRNTLMTYNGEIYNYKDLPAYHKGKQDSDTITLYHHLQENGIKGVKDLNGIFAFAYLNKSTGEFQLTRDRLGVKPLYYMITKEYFVFASEAKVLYDYLAELTINWQAVHEFIIHGSVIGDQNIVRGVRKVSPGSYVSFNINNWELSEHCYWSVPQNIMQANTESRPTYDKAKRTTKQLLEEGVRRQCRSDVSIGAYLSGGIDSSLVVALAAQNTGKKLKTFSASFEGSSNSELPLAKQVSNRYNTEHHEFQISTRGIEDELKDIIYQYDDPFADPAAIPLHLMAKECSKTTKVVLQGDGGDELFAGYGRHLDASELWLRKMGFPILSALYPDKSRRQTYKGRAKSVHAKPGWRKLGYMVSGPYNKKWKNAFKPEIWHRIDESAPYEIYNRVEKDISQLPFLQQLLYTDMQIILPYTFMEKVDKINMYHSVEARVPLLDNEVIDYVMKLPGTYKIRKRTTKYLLRDIAKEYLPIEVLNGRKQSFGTPMGIWLRTILYGFVKDVFHRLEKLPTNPFNMETLREMLDAHESGRADYSNMLWRSTVLLIWLELYAAKIRVE